MKKILSLLFVFLAIAITAKAQSVAINTTGATANSTSILDVGSTTKGMLIPRMSSVQRTAIGTPANGLLVYDTDSAAFSYYNGIGWSFIKGNSNIAVAWSTKGNSGTTAANFIGTIDNQDVIFKRWDVKAGLLGFSNTSFGYHAFVANTTGNFNAAFGVEALISNTTGNSNVGIGLAALYRNTGGSNNTASGSGTLSFNTIGSNNTASGSGSLYFNSTGSYNTANGDSALYNNTTGSSNVAIGKNALYNNTVQSNLVAIGDSALYNNGTGATLPQHGKGNTAIGSKALFSNTTGLLNNAMGNQSLYQNTTGSDNSAIGTLSLFSNITGSKNIAIGTQPLYKTTVGSGNIALGYLALFENTTGNNNVSLGEQTLYNNQTGSFNIAIGYNTLNGNTLGTNNIAIGRQAGGILFNNGFYNTYIGDSTLMLANRTNSTVIGNKAYTSTNNSMVLGSINGVNGATADVNVGIGVTNPTEKLEIGNGRLRFRGNAPLGNAHGITWTNNAGTADRAFIGMETDNFLGIYNFGFPPGWNIRIHNSTGEMGINKQPGTTPSESRLQVKQTTAGANYGIGIETAINTNRWDMFVDNNTTPDYNFSYNGSLKGYIQNATGNYIVVSDKRFKKDVTDFSASLSNISQLKTYQYHYLDNNAADPFSVGFMAQDVQKLFPDAVSEKIMDDGKKRLGVNYQYFTVLAIKGLQEQQGNIESQNKKIEVLENQVAELKKLVEELIKK
ncbi:tail fiber domain-containing protein [Ferruginibacter sp.]|nr:tail fiber domain-containing protein [Ferruginibacter sp.]